MIMKKKFKQWWSTKFCHYQQNEQSPVTTNHWTLKKNITYGAGNPGPGLWQTQTCGRAKLVNGTPKMPDFKLIIDIKKINNNGRKFLTNIS